MTNIIKPILLHQIMGSLLKMHLKEDGGGLS